MIAAVRLAAPAKFNLYLHVLGRRHDGYHLLDSLIAFAGVHDTLSFSPGVELSLRRRGPEVAALPAPDQDLIARTANSCAQALGQRCDASIDVVKRLPVAAGMGGGSSDAAAALRGLATLWQRDVADLAPLAATLGADVPVCLFGRAAFVGGIGDDISAAPALPPAHLVLVNPRLALPTADVFHHCKPRDGVAPAKPFTQSPRDAQELASWLRRTENDLTAAAVSLAPVIDTVLAAIAAQPGCLLARMTGSGATGFGLFDAAHQAADAATSIGRAEPGWWVAATPLVHDIAGLAAED